MKSTNSGSSGQTYWLLKLEAIRRGKDDIDVAMVEEGFNEAVERRNMGG